MIAALYALTDGPYFGLASVDPWDIERDARKYKGPHRVIAHPPCQRWGRYWGGGPMLHGTPRQKVLGDDDGCFSHALWSVRTFGGVLEHPEASHAWKWHGLTKPPFNGGWIEADNYGGYTCCVAQGHYGHRAQKMTWLYSNKINRPELKWGRSPNLQRMDEGWHSKEERARAIRTGVCQRLSKRQRETTPDEFRDLLIRMVS